MKKPIALKRRGFYDRVGGRKFLIAAGALCMAFLLAMLKRLTGDFALVASVCVGAFAGADAFVTGRAINKGASLPSSPGPGDRE